METEVGVTRFEGAERCHKPSSAGGFQKLENARLLLPWTPPGGARPRRHLAFRLVTSRTVSEYVYSLIVSH